MTNGELFFKTFPCLEQDEQWPNLLWWTDEKGNRQLLGDVYDSDFWNSEYKEPTTKNDLADNKTFYEQMVEYCKDVWEDAKKALTTKNYLGVDAVSRKDVHDMLENLPITAEDKWFNRLQKACMRLAELPSVTPQLSSELDKNSQKLEKDLGELDCISRADVKAKKIYSHERHKYVVPVAEIDWLPSVTPQEPRCKDCKWWKDSDGKFRRGCGAESPCPINTSTVYCGDGYCYMFQPKADMEGNEV